MSGHTPGKWASSEIAYSTHNRPDHFWEVTVYADSTPVADAVGNSQARAIANARLIAAAPKLLAAAAKASVALNNYCATAKPDYEALTEAASALTDAINSAAGETA